MNNHRYYETTHKTTKEQMRVIESETSSSEHLNLIMESCLTNMMFLLAHLTDEVSSVADELALLRKKLAKMK